MGKKGLEQAIKGLSIQAYLTALFKSFAKEKAEKKTKEEFQKEQKAWKEKFNESQAKKFQFQVQDQKNAEKAAQKKMKDFEEQQKLTPVIVIDPLVQKVIDEETNKMTQAIDKTNDNPGATATPGHSGGLPGSGAGNPGSAAEAGLEATESGQTTGMSVGETNAAGADAVGAGDDGQFGPPVLLDLNGDGIEIISLGQSRAHFDIDGDGRRQIMAWVGPDDALLVYDRDGDRLISHRDEIAFADYLANAKTDLEGLAYFDMAAHGGNEDGVLNALDALWSKFGVWRDVDQDGETDPGELTMTGEGGLSSVSLQSDQIPRDAGPDAQIYGKGEYQTTDADGRMRSGDL